MPWQNLKGVSFFSVAKVVAGAIQCNCSAQSVSSVAQRRVIVSSCFVSFIDSKKVMQGIDSFTFSLRLPIAYLNWQIPGFSFNLSVLSICLTQDTIVKLYKSYSF